MLSGCCKSVFRYASKHLAPTEKVGEVKDLTTDRYKKEQVKVGVKCIQTISEDFSTFQMN